jgi:hypothetical protein
MCLGSFPGLSIVPERDYVDEPILIVVAWPPNVNRPGGGVIDVLVASMTPTTLATAS